MLALMNEAVGVSENTSVSEVFGVTTEVERNAKVSCSSVVSATARRLPIDSAAFAAQGGGLSAAGKARLSAQAGAPHAVQGAWLADLPQTAHFGIRYTDPASVIRSRHRTKVR